MPEHYPRDVFLSQTGCVCFLQLVGLQTPVSGSLFPSRGANRASSALICRFSYAPASARPGNIYHSTAMSVRHCPFTMQVIKLTETSLQLPHEYLLSLLQLGSAHASKLLSAISSRVVNVYRFVARILGLILIKFYPSQSSCATILVPPSRSSRRLGTVTEIFARFKTCSDFITKNFKKCVILRLMMG